MKRFLGKQAAMEGRDLKSVEIIGDMVIEEHYKFWDSSMYSF